MNFIKPFQNTLIPFVITFVFLSVNILTDSAVGFAEEVSVVQIEKINDIDEISVSEITVLGNSSSGKTSVQDYIPTVSEVSGLRLEKKKQATLGETLSREAGVTSSFFGPNASRPVIRGLEGERVRILQDGMSSLDASATSPDHAVSNDPLLTEKIEVVRGSAALLYGSGAIGGVVNVINGRIPAQTEKQTRVTLETRANSADQSRAGGFTVKTTQGPLTYHLDGSLRGSEDYTIPGFAWSQFKRDLPLVDHHEEHDHHHENGHEDGHNHDHDHHSGPNRDAYGTVPDSANGTQDFGLGSSYITDSGYLGLSLSRFSSQYGTVAEPDVAIDLKRTRLDLKAERNWDAWIQSAKFQTSGSIYDHEETETHHSTVEGENDAHPHTTSFSNPGAETRIDLKHKPFAGLEGVFGVQQQYSHMEVTGVEAFIPVTTQTSYALFMYEEMNLGSWTPSFGLRMDRSGVDSETSTRFGGAESFAFLTPSLSGGVLYRLADEWTLGLNTSLTERAPNYQELFANGAHQATGIFEIGDRTLKTEIGRSLELSVRHRTQTGQGRVSAYVQDFNRFIALSSLKQLDTETELPMYSYRSVQAFFFGAELEYRQQLPWRLAKGGFELAVTLDWVRGINQSDSTNLPRITPVRETIGLAYQNTSFSAEFEMQRAEAQYNLAPNEIPTNSYSIFNFGVEVPIKLESGQFYVLTKFNNIFNTEARNHVSFVKDIAPLPGRSLMIGLQARL